MRKAFVLGNQCVVYSEKHGNHYPRDFQQLVEAGQISQDQLNDLLRIQDSQGPWTSRKWIYTPDDKEILFYASQPAPFTQTVNGKQTTDIDWIVWQDNGPHPRAESELPDRIKNKIQK